MRRNNTIKHYIIKFPIKKESNNIEEDEFSEWEEDQTEVMKNPNTGSQEIKWTKILKSARLVGLSILQIGRKSSRSVQFYKSSRGS